MPGSITDDERAGAVEPFEDAALYDWEYRRRRDDVAFYRSLAHERGGPILDLGCGTGRLALPLLRDGHRVVGVDLSAPMLAGAAARLARWRRARAPHYLLARADLRALPVAGHFPLAIAAFHTVQHLVEDRDLVGLFRSVRRLIQPDGWFAFDVFFPDPRFLARPPNRRFDRVVFRHPVTRRKLAYSLSHRLDPARRALHMRIGYQPLSESGAPAGAERIVRLCHRQLPPEVVERLLSRAGLRILARWDSFEGGAPGAADSDGNQAASEQHVYLAGPASGRGTSADRHGHRRNARRSRR